MLAAKAGGDSTLARANELWVLNSFAVAQPLFDLVGSNPAFLIAHRAETIDVVVVVAALLFAIPVVALLLEAVAGAFGGGFRRSLHRLWLGILVALILHPLLMRWLVGMEFLAVGGALAGGIGFVLLHRAWATGRELLRFMAPAPLVFAAVFLMSDAVRASEGPSETHEIAKPGGPTAPIVFVLLDELPLYVLLDPHREIDAELFPSFARLAADAIWLRNATAVHPMTDIAVPSILTGRRAGLGRYGTLRRSPHNLFTWLADSHRLVVRESVTALCPPEACEQILRPTPLGARLEGLTRDLGVVYGHWALPPSAAEALPPVESRWADFSDQREPLETDALRAFIGSIEGDAPPTLYFLHVLIPHIPWFGLPGGATYLQEDGLGTSKRSREEWPAKLAFQRHLLQVGYVDWFVGELLDRLEELGIYDESLVVVTSDHGVSFRPGEHRRHVVDSTLRDVIHVPLFVKPPGLRDPRIVDRNVESIDILPTMADALGVEIPDWVEGQSALDDSIPPRASKIVVDRGRSQEVGPDLPPDWYGLDLKTELFGAHPTWDDVYALTTAPELLGRRADSILGDERSDLSYQFLSPTAFDDVEPGSRRYPAYVPGVVVARDPGALPKQVALAINGDVRGVGRTFSRLGATAAFAMMVPPDVFRPGENRVELFALDEQRRLRPMKVADALPIPAAVYQFPRR